jgi:hypothetical protein
VDPGHTGGEWWAYRKATTEEREIYALRERLQRYPQAVSAILQAARSLNRPVDTLQPQDVRRLV